MRRHGLIGVVALIVIASLAVPAHAQSVGQGTAVAGVPDQTPPPGQTSTTSQTPRPSGQPSANASRGLSVPTQNVRVEITITDSFAGVTGGGVSGGVAGGVSGGVSNAKKIVTMLIADGFSGYIRSANDVQTANGAVRTIAINVDCIPTVRDNGKIQLNLTVQYAPELSMLNQTQSTLLGPSGPRPASLNESATFLVSDGTKMMVSQSADPATDRKVTIEVTATIVR